MIFPLNFLWKAIKLQGFYHTLQFKKKKQQENGSSEDSPLVEESQTHRYHVNMQFAFLGALPVYRLFWNSQTLHNDVWIF